MLIFNLDRYTNSAYVDNKHNNIIIIVIISYVWEFRNETIRWVINQEVYTIYNVFVFSGNAQDIVSEQKKKTSKDKRVYTKFPISMLDVIIFESG